MNANPALQISLARQISMTNSISHAEGICICTDTSAILLQFILLDLPVSERPDYGVMLDAV